MAVKIKPIKRNKVNKADDVQKKDVIKPIKRDKVKTDDVKKDTIKPTPKTAQVNPALQRPNKAK